jgi:hypothetical protein
MTKHLHIYVTLIMNHQRKESEEMLWYNAPYTIYGDTRVPNQ